MKSVYFTMFILAVLVFSLNISGQDEKQNPEIKNWTVVVTDNFAPKKTENDDDKKAKTAKSKKAKSETKKEEKTAKIKAENSDSLKKTDEVFSVKRTENTDEEKTETKTEETSKSEPNPAAKKLADWEKTWSILAKFSTSFDTNIEHDPVGVKSFGFVPSITAGYQMRSSNQRLRFIYSFAAPRYTAETDLTRIGNYFVASYRYSLGKWSFETDGEVSLKGTSEDRETNDQYILTETISYRFDKNTRLGVYGAYRIRRFPAEDADRNAVNPMLGLKFSRQLNKKIEWNASYRYDENRSINPRQNYIRTTYKTGFDMLLTKKDFLETEVSYRPRRYSSRLVEVGDAEFLRRDKKWSFDAVWKHNVKENWGFEAGYQFEKQTSNDFEKIYNNHQIVFSIFYHWGKGDVIEP